MTAKRLRIGPFWTVARPCVFRWRAALRLVGWYDLELASTTIASDRAFISLGPSGMLNVGMATPAAIAATDNRIIVGTHQGFPFEDALLAEWGYNKGTWNLDGDQYIAPLVNVFVDGGQGIQTLPTPHGVRLEMDAFVPFKATPPLVPGSCATVGTAAFAVDKAGFFYFCVIDPMGNFRWMRGGPLSSTW
ncbi:hypothetical protein EPO44_10265 [bacterium]|nr:MAG: hypothetical protein EPO44_10265 [bacterium]